MMKNVSPTFIFFDPSMGKMKMLVSVDIANLGARLGQSKSLYTCFAATYSSFSYCMPFFGEARESVSLCFFENNNVWVPWTVGLEIVAPVGACVVSRCAARGLTNDARDVFHRIRVEK